MMPINEELYQMCLHNPGQAADEIQRLRTKLFEIGEEVRIDGPNYVEAGKIRTILEGDDD